MALCADYQRIPSPRHCEERSDEAIQGEERVRPIHPMDRSRPGRDKFVVPPRDDSLVGFADNASPLPYYRRIPGGAVTPPRW